MAGNLLFVFNDGSTVAAGQDSTFSVFDDSGNALVQDQRLTDATDDELAGWNYLGYQLSFYSLARHVQVHEDGSFTIHYEGQNPVLQRDTGADPKFVAMRTFSADGAGQASQPGMIYIDPDGPNTNSIVDLPGGLMAEVWFGNDGTHPDTVNLIVQTGPASTTELSFTATGETYLGFLAARPASIDLAVSGDRLHLVYQDVQSGDVFSRVYDLDGTEIRAETLISGDANAFFNRAAADVVNTAVLEDGRIVVTWSNQREGVDTDPELFHMILNADGSVARAPQIVNTDDLNGTQYDGLVFPLSDGGYVIVYHVIGGSPYRQEALARQFDALGEPVTGTVSFPGVNGFNAHHAAVFPNGFGYMLDGLGDDFTILVDGQTTPVTPPSEIMGTPGNDDLGGTDGADTIRALAGDDNLDGGPGADVLDGGAGSDTADYISSAGSVFVDLINTGDNTGDAAGDSYVSIENIRGGLRADDLRGDHGDNLINGSNGNDFILGRGGVDTLIGGNGDDTLAGMDGNDVLNGGADNDVVSGGQGNDRLLGGTGNDLLVGTAGNNSMIGGSGNDTMFDGRGDSVLFGGTGADRLIGGVGNDRLLGDFGNDNLAGNNGNDTLSGGAGNDYMVGGNGVDIFVFQPDMGADRIEDFELGLDRLFIASALTGGETDAATVLASFADASGGSVFFDFGGGNTLDILNLTGTAGLELDMLIT